MAYVDWEFAKTTGRTLVPAGPSVTRAEAEAEVAAIRAAARAAREPVAETARMQTPPTTRRTPSSSTAPPGSRSTPTR